MKRLTGSKKVFAVASAVFLVAAASGTALAMIDQGFGSVRGQPVQHQIRQNTSGQAQQSPLPTPTNTPESHGNEVEFRGTVEAIATTGWVIDGRTVQVTGDTLVEMGVDVGSQVKVHAQRQADGSLVASKIELIQNGGGDDNGNGNENENENENHNGNVNSNDDHGNENENENHSGNVNSNDNDDDHGNGNSNDDHGGHDDHGNSNDNHGGHGNDNHGGDDHGGNGDN